MNNDNGFDLLIIVVFYMSPELVRLGPKAQDLVIYFPLVKGDNIPQFHLRYLQARSELFLLKDTTGQMNNLTGKDVTELSKLKHLQWYVNNFGIEHRKFERKSKDTNSALYPNKQFKRSLKHSRNRLFRHVSSPFHDWPHCKQIFWKNIHHQNGPNKHQHIHKITSKSYQSRSYQRQKISSNPHLKEDCLGCDLKNRGMR